MRVIGAWVLTLAAAITAVVVDADRGPSGKPFPYLDPAFTQQLFGSTSSFKISYGNLGGVAVLPNGDVVVAECVTKDTRLHKFLAAVTIERHDTKVHPETIIPSAGGCGLTYHPDGSLYLNMDDGTSGFGVANVNTNGTTRRLLGPRGNALGIAVDPITNHLVYAGRTCRPGAGSTCTLFDLDPVTGVATNRAVLSSSVVGYVDGIAFDPTGGFIFLANRFPQKRLTILDRSGAIVQHVAMTSEPIGIWFHSDSPAFVVTNNMDGSISRFDFPGNVYAQPPAVTKLADQGFRGDLIQAGADGCLYVTQGGSRYDNGDVEDGNTENSIVQICAGFAVPPGLTPAPPAGTLDGTVTDLVTTSPIASATVLLSDGTTTTTTDSAGHYSFTLAPGTYDVTVTATGYNNAIANGLVVTNRHTTTQDFTLTKPAGTLTGVVTDTTGALVTTATITLSTGLSTATDGTGSYSFTLPPGTYGATVTAPGYNSATASGLVVTGGGTTTKDFRLVPLPGTLQGIVTSTNPAGTPIVGATVKLVDGTPATTDATGTYKFTSLPPGTYAVTVTATNYTGDSASGLVVTAGGTTTKDFALVPLPGTLQGVVTSTNPAGTPIIGATVKLADGTPATTDATGTYKFTSLPPGTYAVTVTATNYTGDSASGLVVPINGTKTKDFALVPLPGTLQGVVTSTNPAGTLIVGATVKLADGTPATTDATGTYKFTSLPPGMYAVTVTAPNFNGDSASGLVVPSNGTTTKDFALVPLPGTLQGVVTSTNPAGTAIGGATVKLSGGTSVTTDTAGTYTFSSLAPGIYALTVTATNFSSGSASGLAVSSNATTTQNFALTPQPGTLSGTVTDAITKAAIASAKVQVTNGPSTTTDNGGNYSFALPPGTYDLSVNATNYAGTTATGVAVASNATTTKSFALAPQPGTLSGTVTDAITKAAIASAKVQITNGPSTTTDNGGNYSFVLPPGTYDLSVNATNYAGATATGVAVVSNATTTKSFALTPLPGALQGIVTSTSPAGTPIAGATVKLAGGASVTTDATGAYKFTSLAPGMYAVTVTATNFSSGSASGLMVASNGTATQNFALTPLPGTLQGVVTSTNPAGSPVAGATIKLGDGTSVTTDAGGFYEFTSLPPGTYQVTVTAAEYNILTVAGIVVGSNAVTTRNFSIAPLTSDLAMVASGPASATAGTSVTYTFTTTNLGVTAASGVVVKHVMPAQTTFTSVGAPAGWTCTKPAAGGNGTVSCAKSSMAVNESAAISVTVVVACPFPAATMTMAATATTPTLETSSSNNSASIVAAVSTPAPTITGASVDKSTLWPPNHKMVDVKVNYTLTGVSCVGARTTLSIASNEGDAEDYEVVDPHHIRLRSEREGNGSGRTYTITISATNDSKVFDRKTVVVTVDHDQGHGK